MNRVFWGASLICLLTLCASLRSVADEKTSDRASPAPAKLSGWQRLFRKHAAEYRIVDGADEKLDAKLIAEPVLQWSQPVRGGADGAVFIWAQSGRPVVIGTFFIWPRGDDLQGIAHELHSLSQLPLTGTWRERKWSPPKDSLTWTRLTEAPVPAKSAEQRLLQMRELARQFRAESQDKNDRKWELRLLPRPVFRYQLTDAKSQADRSHAILDGALFGFVEGTDLEVVLLLEATENSQGRQWNYALARMSDLRLKVQHANREVWKTDASGYDNPTQSYYCTTVESRKSPDDN